MITYILADNITPSTLSLLSQLNASLLGVVDSGVASLGVRINEVNESLALATAAVDSELREALSGSTCVCCVFHTTYMYIPLSLDKIPPLTTHTHFSHKLTKLMSPLPHISTPPTRCFLQRWRCWWRRRGKSISLISLPSPPTPPPTLPPSTCHSMR